MSKSHPHFLHISCLCRNKQYIYEIITTSLQASLCLTPTRFVHKPFIISSWQNVCKKIQTLRFPHISVYCDLRSIRRPYGWGSVSVTSYNLQQQTELLIISTTTSGVLCLLTKDNHSQELEFNLRMYPNSLICSDRTGPSRGISGHV